MTTFANIVDAADRLSLDEQQTLLGILRQRVAARSRDELVDDVKEARTEFQENRTSKTSVDELMDELGRAS